MSKSYGRNQKRAAAKQIATLTEKNASQALEVSHWRGAQQSSQHVLANVARVLGDNFFGLPPVQRHATYLPDYYDIPRTREALLSMMPPSDLAYCVDYAVDRLGQVKLEGTRDALRGCMHLQLQTPAGAVAYYVSDAALQQMPRAYLEEQLAPLVAYELASVLKQRYFGGSHE